MHTFEDLCNSADDELFIKIRKYSNHILHGLLPPPSTASQNYSLRQRAHSHIFLTVIKLCVWCTRTPTRPSHCFLHYIYLVSMYFSCLVCVLSCLVVTRHERTHKMMMMMIMDFIIIIRTFLLRSQNMAALHVRLVSIESNPASKLRRKNHMTYLFQALQHFNCRSFFLRKKTQTLR